MEKELYYSELYDYYGELFTNIQQKYFEDYYFNNLTLQEIAENYEVSRNAIHKQITSVCEKLNWYEEKLNLRKKNKRIEEIIKNLDENVKEEINNILYNE